jgi:arabinose-5-phosphate isomerase
LNEQIPRDREGLQALAHRVLGQESAAIEALQNQLDPDALQQGVTMILGCQGVILVAGAGTSSGVAHRLAHLLTCAGARAFYLDAGQAQHGYSAIVTERDVVIALSRGGETDEVNHLLRLAQKYGAGVIGITERPDSTLGQLSDVRLLAGVAPVFDAGGAIPLASTLAHAAVGDVLCAAVLAERGLSEREFAAVHPGGAVGKRLGRGTHEVDPAGSQDLEGLRSLRGLLLDMDGVL